MNLRQVISGQGSDTRRARDSYFQEFDTAMRLAETREDSPEFRQSIARMEQHGAAAGVAANEIAYRRSTLLYSLTQGMRR